MGKDLYNNVAIRALNQTKTLNPIIYLAIRCFFENFSKKYGDINLLEEYIKRKLYVRKTWSIKENKLYKEKEKDEFIYRDILVLSAFGVICESFLMRKIVEMKCLENKDYIYSYILPDSKKSTRNYKYYFNGYRERNEAISLALNNNRKVLVLDLQKFYPSINKENVKKVFINKIKQNNDEIYNLSLNIITSLLNSSYSGIPIGPDLSHLMAQIYLEDFDKKMIEKFPNNYFRYVDDIAIVCNDDVEKEYIKNFVKSSLPPELSINESKTDELTLDKWQILIKQNDKKSENFNEILNEITAFISMHPLKIDDLEQMLNKQGFNIPLRRIKKQSKSKNYMKFIQSLMRGTSFLSTYEIYYMKPESIISKLISLKDFYLLKFNELSKFEYSDDNSAENRSNTQQLKFILNRLLYLCTLEELEELLINIPETEKFSDTKEVILALSNKNLVNTIKFGGKLVQTVCELWKENNFSKINFTKEDFLKFNNLNEVIDSIIIMYLYQVITFKKDDILEYLDSINQEYFLLIIDETYIPTIKDNEYIMELYGLLKNVTLERKNELLFTRYDNDESLQLAGLDLGIGYSL
ncbi:RNA-directed DNA polymerase [Arcobacter lanthieri]|uniref:RNA-directed DNA polymerase n=1 Tax=Aliarcobacter lanthieri TaxID=1355374 RepID=UPI00192134F3|nr:RNA-directed DNA polymerase [Aliarcobacter lanthieri]MBL3518898.1 RNA-directed DNA polymerase [Aliarcobacter lanthieri]